MATQRVTSSFRIQQPLDIGKYLVVQTTNSSTTRERRFVPSLPPLNGLNSSDDGGTLPLHQIIDKPGPVR